MRPTREPPVALAAAEGSGSQRVPTAVVARATLVLVVTAIAVRIVAALVIAVAARHYHDPFATLVTRFDGTYYRQIASSGYPSRLPVGPNGQVEVNATAFFPLYPLVVKLLTALGIPFYVAGLLVNGAAAVAAALLIRAACLAVGKSPGFAVTAAALWLVWPIAFTSTLTYGDTLYAALAAACLLCLLQERWVLAGLCAGLAGATRPTGVLLCVVCLYVAVQALRPRRDYRPLIAVVLSPLGLVAYFAYLWAHTGRATAWFVTESQGWRVYFDGGANNVSRAAKYITTGNVVGIGLVLFILAGLALLVALIYAREHTLFLLWSALVVLMALTSRNDISSVPRFLYPAFPLLMPIVHVLVRARWALVLGLGIASLISMCSLGVYFTAHSHYPP